MKSSGSELVSEESGEAQDSIGTRFHVLKDFGEVMCGDISSWVP